MKNEDIIVTRIRESIAAKQTILSDRELLNTVSVLSTQIVNCIKNRGKLVICGNGGSASDAIHFSGEIIGKFQKDRKPWPAITLNADIATLTSVANDYSYDEVFSRQVEAFVNNNDLFIGISTSGNSENVYRACVEARKIGAKTACLVGHNGGKIAEIADFPVIIPNNTTARIQECHILIIHILCEIVEKELTLIERK